MERIADCIVEKVFLEFDADFDDDLVKLGSTRRVLDGQPVRGLVVGFWQECRCVVVRP